MSCDWYTGKAVIHKGEAQAATTYTVSREALDGAALQQALTIPESATPPKTMRERDPLLEKWL